MKQSTKCYLLAAGAFLGSAFNIFCLTLPTHPFLKSLNAVCVLVCFWQGIQLMETARFWRGWRS